VILAAGKGVRMKSDMPKVLHSLHNKPLIQHVIDNLKKSGIVDIIVVVGYRGDDVIKAVKGDIVFVWQHEQLGTGHAVLQAERALDGFQGNVIIACGDVPLLRPETFRSLAGYSSGGTTKAVVLTMKLENPFGYGRIIRDESDNFVKIVEEKDADDCERMVQEVNTGTYIVDKELLFESLKCIGNDNAQKEYYLPDVLTYIVSKGYVVKAMMIDDPIEGSGINSKDDLEAIQRYLVNSK
jgi:UDP-N-acetylglucosamine diphosphorylase/glucosamine-1-phosphate N-acetyltransferase